MRNQKSSKRQITCEFHSYSFSKVHSKWTSFLQLSPKDSNPQMFPHLCFKALWTYIFYNVSDFSNLFINLCPLLWGPSEDRNTFFFVSKAPGIQYKVVVKFKFKDETLGFKGWLLKYLTEKPVCFQDQLSLPLVSTIYSFNHNSQRVKASCTAGHKSYSMQVVTADLSKL